MGRKVFISYSHRNGDWVWNKLVCVLEAGGAEVIIDKKRFELGLDVFKQMDVAQDEADVQLLVLSEPYFKSSACCHEMKLAIGKDPEFIQGFVIAIKLDDYPWPDAINCHNPLFCNLHDDADAEQWDKLMRACQADLCCRAPHWMEVKEDILRFLNDGQSVNMQTKGSPKPCWRPLIEQVCEEFTELGRPIDMESGAVASRRAFLQAVVNHNGSNHVLPDKPEDLVRFSEIIEQRPHRTYAALIHFHRIATRNDYKDDYDLFGALRNLVTEKRKLILLLQSRFAFIESLPQGHALSSFSNLKHCDLLGRK